MNDTDHPAICMLTQKQWDHACSWLQAATRLAGLHEAVAGLPVGGDKAEMRAAIAAVVDDLYERRNPVAGGLALAWSMLTADPRRPRSVCMVLPQLQWLVDHVDDDVREDLRLDDRMDVWWRAAAGDYAESRLSVFALAENSLKERDEDPDVGVVDPPAPPSGPGLVVMPKSKAAKIKGDHVVWKDMVDARLPLVVARDVAGVRRTLLAEYPHAATAVDLLLRDLRDGEPVRLKPALLVGPPGNGKSRLIRRLGDLLGCGVYRFDGGSSSDGVGFGGTPRGWSDSIPCVPARAVQQFRIANPIVMVDEVEKASPNPRNGALWSVLLAHLERETAARHRDAALDSELDLSWVSHLATANSLDRLPDPLRDRYRIVKVPAPRLCDLPALAANVMREIAKENGEQGFEMPLAADELEVIAAAWQRAGLSIRKLQKIVAATLQARDEHARRH
jgi:hypothetical protein